MEQAIESLTDAISGSPSRGKRDIGIICLHVDDIFCVGGRELYQMLWLLFKNGYQIGPEDLNDVLFVGRGVRWKTEDNKSFHTG